MVWVIVEWLIVFQLIPWPAYSISRFQMENLSEKLEIIYSSIIVTIFLTNFDKWRLQLLCLSVQIMIKCPTRDIFRETNVIQQTLV